MNILSFYKQSWHLSIKVKKNDPIKSVELKQTKGNQSQSERSKSRQSYAIRIVLINLTYHFKTYFIHILPI